MATETTDTAYEHGFSKTVYSLVQPHSKDVFEHMMRYERDLIHSMYDQAWTKRQDNMHEKLFTKWLDYADAINFPVDQFMNRYPTAGSSEAIRAVIGEFASTHKVNNRIHVFKGEYEGYKAFAQAHNVRVVEHDRNNYSDYSYVVGDLFIISQPSSIDGNVWSGFSDFVKFVESKHGALRLAVDLCYVGCTPFAYKIPLTSPVVDFVFFSLSKSFGVYYHRIGGVFSRHPIPSLHGNMWFKNLFELEYGHRLMDTVENSWTMPEQLRSLQSEAIEHISEKLGCKIYSSDVSVLGWKPFDEENATELDHFLRRGDVVRYCLTPYMDQKLNG